MKIINQAVFIILSVALLSSTYAADSSIAGRYLTNSVKPKPAQINLLSQIIQVRFPQDIQTVGEAINYILRFSGYSLVAPNRMEQAFITTMTKPLPVIDRELGPISLQDGLITLAGPAFYFSHDPINRVVNFHLKPKYKRGKA